MCSKLHSKKITYRKITFQNCACFDKSSTPRFSAHSRPELSYVLSNEVRTDNSDHLPIKWDVQRCDV